MIENRQTLKIMAIPRVESLMEVESLKKNRSNRYIIVVLRTITYLKDSSLKFNQSHLNNYTMQSGMADGCVSSSLNREKNNTFKISQIWKDSESLKVHMESPEYLTYQKLLAENRVEENVTVKRVHSL